MSPDEAELLIAETAAKLGEHFNAVQIMASWNEEGMTYCEKKGCGDWYARQGMAHEFIQCDQAQTIGREVARQMPPPPEEIS